ncbi:hypothetical protein AA106555_0525 [Neokomagataea thailandica NBRC 106555]|uniref:DUF1491 family protein n=2 Tax=Neokomagataea TaxID=1223423 RepID=A0A4Y6V844_9PROT|nr:MULTISPECIES: DUF1491 family protein [Neokomagataea]QDH25048.1 DUF1491 family protein [Neokomagataea tanensis]GBR51380.1 hypothetical protein AA106555_0525 [Neokomagataea thailandica NBRC 106555]
MPRLKTGLWVRATLRRFNDAGSSAMVLNKGDEDAGAVLIVLEDTARNQVILREDGSAWVRTNLLNDETINEYLMRQMRYDPDLWVIEINVPDCSVLIEKDLGSRTSDDDEPEELFW